MRQSLGVLMVLLLGFCLACGGDADSVGTATPGTTATSAVGSTPVADPYAIRDVNFETQADVRSALQRISGAVIAPAEIEYVDLTGDEGEEAIVPVSSDGTMGNILYLVFTMQNGEAVPVLTRSLDANSPSGLRLAVEEGVLVEYVGEFGPEDPLCCPSLLRRTTFAWDGAVMQEAGEERIPAGQKE